MKEIEKELIIYGDNAVQIKRIGDVAIYERTGKYNEKRYEVIIVQHFKERYLKDGTLIPAGKYYPSTSLWGNMAWSYIKKENAEKKFDKVLKEVKRNIAL